MSHRSGSSSNLRQLSTRLTLAAVRRTLALVRLSLAEIVVPVGVAALVGIALAAAIVPRWRAPGMPYFLGYGKNVESAALAGALAAGAATQWLVRSRRGLAACLVAAVLGLALVVSLVPLAPLLAGWPALLSIAVLATMIGRGQRAGGALAEPPAGRVREVGGGGARDGGAAGAGDRGARGGRTAVAYGAGLAAALTVGALAAAVLAVTVGPPLLSIDTYHHGEVLSTAVDLLRGGRPFETLLWPHGLHDTGLAALWILATGKIGTSPVALAWASCCALGVVALYVVGRRLLGSRAAALAVCVVAVLAPVLAERPQADAQALYQLGELFFVVLGFAAVTSRRRDLVAGLCFGLAYLFRIESALYGVLAALAVIAYRDLLAPVTAGETWTRAAAKAAAGSLSRLLGGAALVLVAARLILGWPGAEWYAETLWELPRYHRDAAGFPLPWPRRGVEPSPLEALWLSRALARLLLTLLLLVQALRQLLERQRSRPHAVSERTAQLLFVAVFAAAAAKSVVDRSDLGHVLQWSALPLLATACLAFSAWRERRSWTRSRAGLALVVLIALLDFGDLGLEIPVPRTPAAAAAAARQRWEGFVEHLAPNPSAGSCADRMFTPGESRLAANRAFIAGTCAVEAMLRSHGVARLVVADSASWYYVRFRMPFPTRFFATARAYTPPRQFELIRELRASRPQALLLVRGYGALGDFDIPDAVRVSVVDAYLRGRRRGVAVTPTPLGDLFFWDEPARCAPAARTGGESPRAELGVELVAYQPMSGLLFAKGWALDGATHEPLAALTLREAPAGAAADFELGRQRDDLVEGSHREAMRHSGWELMVRGWQPHGGNLAARADPADHHDHAGDALDLAATAAGGRQGRVRLDLSGARILGPLLGAEWNGLGAAIDRAAAMGSADRARALADLARAGSRAVGCDPPAGARER
jgi:hypothetical protein